MRLGARAIECVRDHGRIQYWLPVQRPRAGPGDKGRDKHAGPEKGDSIHQRTSREVESPSPVASPEDHGIIIAKAPLARGTLVERPNVRRRVGPDLRRLRDQLGLLHGV